MGFWLVVITDLAMLFLLMPAYKEIMDELVAVVESVINTPLTPGEHFMLYALPIVWLIASLFWIGWRIYKSRSTGGIKF